MVQHFIVLKLEGAILVKLCDYMLERGGSVVECRTRNRESPGSNPL